LYCNRFTAEDLSIITDQSPISFDNLSNNATWKILIDDFAQGINYSPISVVVIEDELSIIKKLKEQTRGNYILYQSAKKTLLSESNIEEVNFDFDEIKKLVNLMAQETKRFIDNYEIPRTAEYSSEITKFKNLFSKNPLFIITISKEDDDNLHLQTSLLLMLRIKFIFDNLIKSMQPEEVKAEWNLFCGSNFIPSIRLE